MTFEETVLKYKEIFGLHNWKIQCRKSTISEGAKTVADPRYNRAVIDYNITEQSNIDELVIHELIHIVMAMYDMLVDNIEKEENQGNNDSLFFMARENATSQLTAIMMRLLNEGKH